MDSMNLILFIFPLFTRPPSRNLSDEASLFPGSWRGRWYQGIFLGVNLHRTPYRVFKSPRLEVFWDLVGSPG